MSCQLLAGFGRADITPEVYMGIAGFGTDAKRICERIIDHPMGSCVAIADETGGTMLLVSVDLLQAEETTTVLYGRKAITQATGVPPERIMICATHTHSGPSMYTMEDDSQRAYILYLSRQLAKAAKEAMDDLTAAKLYIGSRQVENMTFVRHYLMNDGTYAGANFGSFKSGIKRHLFPADDQMQLIRFERENARDIVMMNWQSHCTFIGHPEEGVMSADYIAPLRDHFEGLTGCHFAFYQGAAGNLVPTSRIEELNRVGNDHIAYGRLLAEEAVKCMESLTPAQGGTVRNRQCIYEGKVDHSDDGLLEQAMLVRQSAWDLPTWSERAKFVKSHGFNSIWHAAQVVDRYHLPQTISMELDTLCAGDIAFATVPCEWFCSNGKTVKDNSPFAMTFVLGYCNGRKSYIPDEAAFDYGCYEVDARRFYKGVAEEMAQHHLSALDLLKGEDAK